MGKKRTRKEKERAKYRAQNLGVKWQTQNTADTKLPDTPKRNLANRLAKDTTYPGAKKEIIKSLFRASLILALELVIYLAWKK